MINYNAPERQALVTELLNALSERASASINFPFTAWQFWRAGRRAAKAIYQLNEYDIETQELAEEWTDV